MLSHSTYNVVERNRLLQCIEETSLRAINFAAASYSDRAENYPNDVLSPYLTYSLYQAAIVQYRLWKQNGDPMCKRHLDSLKSILREFTGRWMIACESFCARWDTFCTENFVTQAIIGQYLDILENLNESWPPIALPFQGLFISTGKLSTTF